MSRAFNLNELKPPSTAEFPGAWETDFGDLDLHIEGTRVTGTYGPNFGSIEGTISGNVVRGTWRQRAACRLGITWGTFTMTLSSDGKSFKGQWTYLDDFAPGGGTWFGRR